MKWDHESPPDRSAGALARGLVEPTTTRAGAPALQRVRAILVLGRISNLPTVWSNCLAAWLLGGGGPIYRFALLCVAASLLYTGGMFLNDAADVDFDRQYRPERPIVSGQVSLKFVWLSSVALFLGGWLCLFPFGDWTLGWGLALTALIVVYDLVHKKTSLAPVLMAGCRFLLYLVSAAAAGVEGGPKLVLGPAIGLALYIIGLSYIARKESTGPRRVNWPIPLLFLPVILSLALGAQNHMLTWIAAGIVAGWVFWCIAGVGAASKLPLPRGVAGLLAGIALLDGFVTVSFRSDLACVCVGLFFMAIFLQRVAPAT